MGHGLVRVEISCTGRWIHGIRKYSLRLLTGELDIRSIQYTLLHTYTRYRCMYLYTHTYIRTSVGNTCRIQDGRPRPPQEGKPMALLNGASTMALVGPCRGMRTYVCTSIVLVLVVKSNRICRSGLGWHDGGQEHHARGGPGCFPAIFCPVIFLLFSILAQTPQDHLD